MCRTRVRPAAGKRNGRMVLGLIAGVLFASAAQARAQTPPAQTPPAQPAPQAQTPPATRVFGSDAGLVLNFIKADKTADFEAVITKLKEALAKSDKPERKQQAAGWRVFKAVEPGPTGTVLYVFIIDPPVKGADYTVSTILADAFPQEVQALFEKYRDAYAQGQNFVNLTLVSALGQ
jgi:hypothetical protein